MDEIYAMVDGFLSADVTSSSFTPAPAATTFFATPTTFPSTIFTTPSIPTNNNQMLDNAFDYNGFHHNINNTLVASSYSATATNTFIPISTNPNSHIPITRNIHGMGNSNGNSFVPSNVASFTTTTTFIPTHFHHQEPSWTIPINNSPNLGGTFRCNMPTTPGSSSRLLPDAATTTTPATLDNQGNWSSSNSYQPMHDNNVRQLLDDPSNPFNFPKRQKTSASSSNLYQPMNSSKPLDGSQKTSLSGKNWPILSLPIFGKLSQQSTNKPQLNQLQENHQVSKCTNIIAHTSSKSIEWKKEKRIYKMPRKGLNSDVYPWTYYGEKLVDGSPYPKKYYKCGSKGCSAKRRVKTDKSDPNVVVVKYIGHHNHLLPNSNLVDSSKAVSSPMLLTKKNNHEDIFDGLENIVDL